MPDQAPAWISITSGELSAEIDPYGAQLSSLKHSRALDLLWNGDAAVWAGRAPLLFPIVGVLAGGIYRLGSKTYALSRHGFARDKRFSVESHGASTASFSLAADDATLRVYPFRFELNVRYALNGATLSVTTQVRNCGDVDMPASFGYHPGFRWPLAAGQSRDSHYIQFETDEPASVRRIDAAGLLTPVRHPTPIVDRRLNLTDALFREDVLILDQLKSRSVTYGSSGSRLRIGFPDAEYLGLWTKPGAPFICIEPWHGITDPQGFSADFLQKPGIFVVRPAEALTARMDITLLALATP
ncbi:MAG TPA: aldose 1-epimerase family protein [Steroidobacteraceae bacterium]|jgi:galactose mutarotase-like enzyme